MTDKRLSSFIRRLRFHGGLSHEDSEAVQALPWRAVQRTKLSYVVREGDRPNEVSVLLSGFAQRQKHTSEGTRQIMAFSLPGDPLDFECLFLDEADFSVQMCVTGAIACVRTEAIRSLLADRPELGRAIERTLLADASVAREWVVNVGRRDSRRRVAHLICEILVRAQAQHMDTSVFELPFTQEQLADATGLTAIHVNRILKQLSTEGAIRRMGRMITVPDWERLREIADFDERFLHMKKAS
jgi:CRP-like cAMP-binding protein